MNSFTQSMAWLHTWGGLLFGWLLFAIFFTGTLSVFPDAITSWMQPELRALGHVERDAALAVALRTLEREAADASRWTIRLPAEERRTMLVGWRPMDGPSQQRLLEPATGEVVHPRDTLGGAFFVRFHYSLLLERIGIWTVGIAVLVMLVAAVTGLVIHKKVFKDFFTFRPRAAGHRSWLDAHTVTGVLMLPFHVMISYTGLIIFMFTFMPAGIQMFFDGDRQAYARALNEQQGEQTRRVRAAAGVPAPLLPIRALVERAEAHWGGLPVTSITVEHPGDRHAVVRMGHFSRKEDEIFGTEGTITFDGVTGDELGTTWEAYPGMQGVRHFSFTLHTARLGGAWMKWLYFLMSAASTATIATGLAMWTVKRRGRMKTPAELRGYRIVERLNVASIAGLLVASVAYFWMNRLLPGDFPDRAAIEVRVAMGVWAACFVHAWLRRPAARAWREQLGAASLLALAIPLLDLSTGRGAFDTRMVWGEWTAVGVDLTAAASGLLLMWTALRIGRERRTPAAGPDAIEAPRLQGERRTSPA